MKLNCCSRSMDVLGFGGRCRKSVNQHVTQYLVMMSTLGMLTNLMDLYRIFACGTSLPEGLKDARIKHSQCVPAERQRDYKLITVFLNLKCFSLLLLGVIYRWNLVMYPWMVIHTLRIVIELFAILYASVTNQTNQFGFLSFVCSLLAIFNWIVICCRLYEIF